MYNPRLTPDNLHLSRVTNDENCPDSPHGISCNLTATGVAQPFATNCNSDAGDEISALVAASISGNTRRAYRSDLEHFDAWGGTIPASGDTVAAYLAAHSRSLSVATLSRRIATISKAHNARGMANPCETEIVRSVLRGIKRTVGAAQEQAKPLLRDDLFLVLDRLGEGMRDKRDRALLLIGFAGGFRRSELVALNIGDVDTVREGMIVTLRSSKTDQVGAGRKIGIPNGRTRYCPVFALEAWLTASRITTGPLFRSVNRHGHVAPEALKGDAVSGIVRERVAAAGMDPKGYSGHSLRAGFATSAAQAGISTFKIRAQTGHASDAMLARYVRDGELFTGNAAGVLL